MKEKTNYEKLEKIFKKNGGFITRKDVDNAQIPSWFLSDFVKRKGLNKIAPGYYADDDYPTDDY
ncbi:MAG: type IV toxin-antitoxin system AbiEi family antitoxin domain-containing protein, partial [Bacilli bacterium]|nr:type IV toxin-antitoxin system AbiEi family antitoxin domain-containing protein [Bacilli bacterium]